MRDYSSGLDWRSVKNFALEEAHSGHINSIHVQCLVIDKKKKTKTKTKQKQKQKQQQQQQQQQQR
jgi:hypothetical protein